MEKFDFHVVGKHIYRFGTELFTKYRTTLDFENFEMIAYYKDTTFYFRDSHSVYVSHSGHYPSALEGADPKTFEIIDGKKGIGYDGKNYFSYAQMLPYDYTQAKSLGEYYTQVNNRIYFGVDEIVGVDTASFRNTWQNLSKDKNHFYFREVRVEEIDVASIKVVPGLSDDDFHLDQSHTLYAHDDQRIYFIDTTAKHIISLKNIKNPEAFRVVIAKERLYGVMGEQYYFFGKKVPKHICLSIQAYLHP